MADAQLFESAFQITTLLDQTYDRVHRLIATSTDSATSLTLDFNAELFPLSSGETFTLLLASTLNLDGTKDEGQAWRPPKAGGGAAVGTLADMWDYVCYGKVYKVEDPEDGERIKVYVSFGGLLLSLDGPYKKLSSLKIEYVYLLLKK